METYEAPEVVELGNAELLTLDSPTGNPWDSCGACQPTCSCGSDDTVLVLA